MCTASKFVSGLIGLVVFSTFSGNLFAYSWGQCGSDPIEWSSATTTMNINTNSFPVNSNWDISIRAVIDEWNDVGGSGFSFDVGYDTDGTYSNTNGVNEIYFLNDTSTTALAQELSREWCFLGNGYFIESDIMMNTVYSWTTNTFTGDNLGSPLSFDLVMIHELGHSLGLKHYDDALANMNTFYFNSGPNGQANLIEPHADERLGVRFLYPDSSTDIDIAASKFHINYSGGAEINKVYTTGGSRTDTTSLARGSDYLLEYTVENLGTVSEDVEIKFFISTNSTISIGDTYIGSSGYSMPAGSFVTADKQFTVPTSLAPGNYYVGYIAMIDGSDVDSNSTNSRVALIDQLTIN